MTTISSSENTHILPPQWDETTLEDLVTEPKEEIVDGPFGSNLKASEYVDDGVPIVRLQNIERNRFVDKNIKYVTPDKARDLKRHNFQPGDILITKLGSPLGKACTAPQHLGDGVIVADVVRLRLSHSFIDRMYLLHAINSEEVAEQLKHSTKGTTRPRVNLNIIRGLRIAVPPLNEQRRIVEKIEELFTKLDAGVRSLEQTQTLLKSYRRSVLKAAVEGELSRKWREAHGDELEPAPELLERILQERREKFAGKKYRKPAAPDTSMLPTLPEEWTWAKSDQLFRYVTSGSRGWAKYYSTEGPAFLRIGNLDHDSITLDLGSIQHVQPPSAGEGTRTRVASKDLLISITADIGMIAVIPPDFREAYINQHIALARPSQEMNIDYLAWYLVSEPGNKQLTGRQYGATKPGLNLDDVRSVHVPLPPLVEQRFIVEEVERRLSVVEKLEATVEANLKQANALRQSILERAFSGELVPQDPDDEPASVLLERIREEREAAKPKARKGRKSSARPTKSTHAEQRGLF